MGTNYSVSLNSDMAVDVDCDVFRVMITVLDDWNQTVEDAKVTVISGDSGKVISSNITDAAGNASVLVPSGNHTMEIYWQDVIVYSNTVYFNGSDITLNVGVHYLNLSVLDARNLPVENAQVSIRHNTTGRTLGSEVTDANGNISIRLPGCMLNITVTWQDALVNHTILNLSSSIDLTINATIYYVTFRMVDSTPAGSPVENAETAIIYVPTGRTLDTNITNSSGEINARLPAGDVEIAVQWQNVEVYRQQITIDAGMSKNVVEISTAIYELELEVVDERGLALEGAQVSFVYQSSGRILASEFTDLDGACKATLPQGLIELTITWHEVVVDVTVHDLVANAFITISADVFYLEITVTDSRGIAVSDATVSLTLAAGNGLSASNLTNQSGFVEFRLPQETYNIETRWMGVIVDTRTHYLEASSTSLPISAAIYYLDILVLDSQLIPVKDAAVHITISETEVTAVSVSTNSTGHTGEQRLPGTGLEIEITWLDVSVANIHYTITSDSLLTIDADIYYLEMEVLDSRDIAVESAVVEAGHDTIGKTQASNVTDARGVTVLRLPGGSISFGITWEGELVHEQSLLLNMDESLILNVDVFYLDIMLMDNRSVPVENAAITAIISGTGISLGSLRTDSTGWGLIRAPVGDIDITARWHDVLVLELQDFTVSGDENYTAEAEIYYLEMAISDFTGEPLEGAHVYAAISDRIEVAASGISNQEGEIEFRLAREFYDIDILWMDKTVHTDRELEISEETMMPVTADVYYLYINVVGNDGKGIDSVYIEVFDSRDELSASGYTTGGGEAVFRLPGGDYTVSVNYRGEYLMTDVFISYEDGTNLDGDTAVLAFTFSEYPPAVYTTNAFLAGLLLALLLLIIVYTIRKGGRKPEDAEEGYDNNYQDEEEESVSIDDGPEIDEHAIGQEGEEAPDQEMESTESEEEVF